MLKKIVITVFSIIIGIVLLAMSLIYQQTLETLSFYVLLVGGMVLLLVGVNGALSLYKVSQNEGKDENGRELPIYKRKNHLVTNAEWDFYQVLKHILPSDKFEILPQMALISVIDKVTHTSYRNELFRIVDFCIMNTINSAPLLLIELNDASHNRADRVERDRKVNDICKRAKMPLVTFTLSEAKDITLVKKTIYKHMLK